MRVHVCVGEYVCVCMLRLVPTFLIFIPTLILGQDENPLRGHWVCTKCEGQQEAEVSTDLATFCLPVAQLGVSLLCIHLYIITYYKKMELRQTNLNNSWIP